MTDAQIEKVRRALRQETRIMRHGSREEKEAVIKKTMEHLVKAGIYTPKGNLRKAYR